MENGLNINMYECYLICLLSIKLNLGYLGTINNIFIKFDILQNYIVNLILFIQYNKIFSYLNSLIIY